VLSRIGQVIGSGSDIDTVMTEVLETISELIVFDSFFVNVLNPDGKTFTDRQVHGTESTQAFDGRIWPLDGSLTRATVSAGRPLKATGLARGEWELGLRSKDEIDAVGGAEVVAIPLVSDGEIFGILQFRSQSQLGHYDRIGDDFLMSLGAQLAGAMAYDQVTEQLSTDLRVQSALAQISQIVGSELDIKTTFDKVAELLRLLIPFDTMFVNTINADAATITDSYHLFDGIESPDYVDTQPLRGTITELVLKSQKPVRVELAADGSWQGGKRQNVSSGRGERSIVGIPLISEGVIVGNLQFRSTIIAAYDDLDDGLLQRIAGQVAGAVAYDQVNSRLQSELVEQTVLARIGQILSASASADIASVFGEFAEVLMTMVEFDSVFVDVINEKTGMLTCLFISGDELEMISSRRERPVKGTLSERAIQLARPARVDADDRGDHAFFTHSISAGFRSGVAIPMISRDEVIGVLHLRSRKIGAFPVLQHEYLTLVAEQISGAMVRAELSENRKILELERDRDLTLSNVSSGKIRYWAYRREAEMPRKGHSQEQVLAKLR
jgi:transcriptional regulator with GAF, ATPase, and Fis domain